MNWEDFKRNIAGKRKRNNVLFYLCVESRQVRFTEAKSAEGEIWG